MLENFGLSQCITGSYPNFGQVTGSGTKLASLANTYQLLTRYSGTALPSLPDYLAPTAGSYCGNLNPDGVHLCSFGGGVGGVGVKGSDGATAGFAGVQANIFSQLDAAGVSWKEYEEDVDLAGYTQWGPSTGAPNWAGRHCPALFYTNTLSNGSKVNSKPAAGATVGRFPFRDTTNHTNGTGTLLADIAASTPTNSALPDFFWITPNTLNDAHSCAGASCSQAQLIKQADDWLRGANPQGDNPAFPGVDALLAAMRPGSTLCITADNANINDGDPGSGHVVMLLCGSNYTGKSPSTTVSNHLWWLNTIQQIYGLAHFTSNSPKSLINPQYTTLASTDVIPIIVSSNPTATVTPTSISFPNTDPGSTSTIQNVTIKNTGGGTLTIPSGGITLIGSNPSKFTIVSGGTTPVSLTSNQSVTVGLKFAPGLSDARGTTFTAQLQFTDNSGGVTGTHQTVNLSGQVTPANPVATLNASSLSFSTAAGSTSTPQTLTVTNTGNSPLHINTDPGGLVLTGTNANLFQISNNNLSGATIAAGASASASITFSPPAGATGTKTATLTINDDSGGAASAQTVSLSGTETVTNGVGTLNPTSVNFGNVTAGTASNAVTVTITNTGGNPSTLTISSVSIVGTQFTIFSDTGQTSLAFNAARTIQVKFNPNSGSTGTLNAILRFVDNSGGVANTNQDVPLTGVAVAPGTGTATITPNPVVFPDTILTQTSKQVVTIQNTGTGNLTISGVTLS